MLLPFIDLLIYSHDGVPVEDHLPADFAGTTEAELCQISDVLIACNKFSVMELSKANLTSNSKLKWLGLRICKDAKIQAAVLPDDIMMEEILTRLPVESVLRFRSVCKSWESVFFTPKFVEAHFARTIRYQDCLIANTSRHGCMILSRYNSTPVKTPNFNGLRLGLIGSINGLVCLVHEEEIFLWNPVTVRYKQVTIPKNYHDYDYDYDYSSRQKPSYLYGFGWDCVDNDFKVVACYLSDLSRRGAIYSSNSDSWTELVIPDYVFPSRLFRGTHIFAPDTIVNGCPYWTYVIYLLKIGRTYTTPLKFDIQTQEFRLLPEIDPAILHHKDYTFFNLKDCFAVMVYKVWSPGYQDEVEPGVNLVDVYLLNESCGVWNKMYTIGPLQDNVRLFQGFKYGDEIVLAEKKKLLCYHPQTDKINGISDDRTVLNCFTYTPSLVFLQGMKQVQQTKTIKPSFMSEFYGWCD